MTPVLPPAPGAQPLMRILIADDDAQDSAALSKFLSRRGHCVRTVGRGTDALAVAPVFRPQIVFLDLCIPEIDGWGVCEQLRVSEHVEEAVIFGLTTTAATEYAVRCRHARFDAYLPKPVELDLAGRLVNCSPQ
jgi:DNA-binding response OmpR family regulator